MRHRVAGRELSRTSAHRLALRRNLAQSLIEHETISTTIEKAKEIKPFVEKLITLARKGTLTHRRRAISLLGDRSIVAVEDGEPVEKGTVIGKLFSELGPRYLDRPGGYTRIIHLSLRRLGDNGQVVLLQLLGEDEPLKKEKKTSGKKRAHRKSGHAAAVAAEEQPADKPVAESGESPQEESQTEAATESGTGETEQPKQGVEDGG
jgi:large subunit ribosomal protein L17